MLVHKWRLTLRDFFWIILIAAISLSWFLEFRRAASEVYVDPIWVREREVTKSSEIRRNTLQYLRGRTDEQIIAEFREFPVEKMQSEEVQCHLTEMARRQMHEELQQRYDEMKQMVSPQFGRLDTLYLLTALRRAQGKPDPLKIHVTFRSAMELDAEVENVDVEGEAFEYTNGCDDRSGRRTRWRVHLTDDRGHRVADSNFDLVFWGGMGGGIGTSSFLKQGEKGSWNNWLQIRKYVSPPRSGIYQMQVLHSNEDIAGDPDLDGLIVWSSEPIKVGVGNFTWPETRGFSLLPIAVVTSLMAVVLGISAYRQFRRQRFSGEIAIPLFTWRDGFSLVLVILLMVSWQFHRMQSSRQIYGVLPDENAAWSLRPLE